VFGGTVSSLAHFDVHNSSNTASLYPDVLDLQTSQGPFEQASVSPGMILVATATTNPLAYPIIVLDQGNVPVQVHPDYLQLWQRDSPTYAFAAVASDGTISSSGGFAGNGSQLTSLSASQLTTGTTPDARLSSNVPLKNAASTFTGANTFSNASNSFTGS